MATIQNINVGTTTNDGTGDTIRNAFIKTNDNFTSVNSDLALKATTASPTFTGTVTANSDAVINGVKVGKGGGNIAQNTAIGTNALNSNATGNYNTAVGNNTLTLNTSNSNTAVGYESLKVNTTGADNAALGIVALNSNTTGNYNTANGTGSLQYNTTGSYNTAVGLHSLRLNTTASDNTALGTQSLYSNTTGGSNVAVGENALYNNTTANNNTAVGITALSANTTGTTNTGLGASALSNNTTFNNVTGLGYDSQITASGQVQLGNASTTTYVYGTVQNRSDLRDKADVRDTVLGLDFISKLRPVDYKWDMREDYKTEAPSALSKDATEEEKEAYKIVMDAWLESVKLDNLNHNGTNKRNRFHHGLIAQEVKEVIEETGVDFGGFQDHKISQGQDVLSIGYDELIAPMIKAIQELKAEIELLKAN
jgi:hypothetical protein